MKKFIQVLFVVVLGFSCSNDSDDKSLIPAVISGSLKCLNDIGIEGVLITMTDELGVAYTSTTNSEGEYDFSAIPSGKYMMSFSQETFYQYTSAEYETIKSQLRDFILAVEPSNNIDQIAYHMINAEDGLTTLDEYYFGELASGNDQLSDVQMPWRYISKDDLDLGLSTVENQLLVDFDPSVQLNIVGIYFGDAAGITCN